MSVSEYNDGRRIVVRVITEKNLENGLILTIVDHSRPVAADRWYVKIVANLRLRAEDYPCPVSDDPGSTG
jgi:hypothetical protein